MLLFIEHLCSHKRCIWMPCSLHESMQHVYSGYPFENSWSHRCHFWMVFFSSWTDLLCLFISFFWKQLQSQMAQLNSFFLSWTDATCILMQLFWEDLYSQMSHLNGFFPSWIALMCFPKFVLLFKILSLFWHPNVFFSSWPDEIWVSNLLFFL